MHIRLLCSTLNPAYKVTQNFCAFCKKTKTQFLISFHRCCITCYFTFESILTTERTLQFYKVYIAIYNYIQDKSFFITRAKAFQNELTNFYNMTSIMLPSIYTKQSIQFQIVSANWKRYNWHPSMWRWSNSVSIDFFHLSYNFRLFLLIVITRLVLYNAFIHYFLNKYIYFIGSMFFCISWSALRRPTSPSSCKTFYRNEKSNP